MKEENENNEIKQRSKDGENAIVIKRLICSSLEWKIMLILIVCTLK